MNAPLTPHHNHYELSIGDIGGGMDDLSDDAVEEVKAYLRESLRGLFNRVTAPWSIDLDTLALLNGRTFSRASHLSLPTALHRSAINAWLGNLNLNLAPASRLWIRADAELEHRCCTYGSGQWKACGAVALLRGPTRDSAAEWMISLTVDNEGESTEVSVPIVIHVSWSCHADDSLEIVPTTATRHVAGAHVEPRRSPRKPKAAAKK